MGIIGITGGIACGKSTATEYLRRYVPAVTDGDKITARLYGPGSIMGEELSAAFGSDVLSSDGSIDKKILGSIVFNDGKRLEQLNAIIQPVIRREILSSLEDSAGRHRILDLALMLEEGYGKYCDEIWVIDTPDDIRIKRLCKRNGITALEAGKIIRSQMSREERLMQADVIIDNSRSLHNTKIQLRKAYRNFCKNYY